MDNGIQQLQTEWEGKPQQEASGVPALVAPPLMQAQLGWAGSWPCLPAMDYTLRFQICKQEQQTSKSRPSVAACTVVTT
jgi:hypothetical protein